MNSDLPRMIERGHDHSSHVILKIVDCFPIEANESGVGFTSRHAQCDIDEDGVEAIGDIDRGLIAEARILDAMELFHLGKQIPTSETAYAVL